MPKSLERSIGNKRRWMLMGLITLVLFTVIGAGMVFYFKGKIHSIFKLNETRKSEGYHLGGFEFQMLGVAYWLDHGCFVKGFLYLNKMHHQLVDREGLIKIPEFADAREKYLFYQNLQNPETGAFMDRDYPLFTYFGPTANTIAYLADELSVAAGEPFRLRYPLKFLDDINRPETLIPLLNDISQVGWIGSKLPKTPFVEVGEMVELMEQVQVLGLYTFSPEWRQALIGWCYENQNPDTGFWGSRFRSTGQWLDGGSLTDTEKIIKVFLDEEGEVIDPDYPLKIFGKTDRVHPGKA